MADPGFPVGGRRPVKGGVDPQCGCFFAKMCAKTKEFYGKKTNPRAGLPHDQGVVASIYTYIVYLCIHLQIYFVLILQSFLNMYTKESMEARAVVHRTPWTLSVI